MAQFNVADLRVLIVEDNDHFRALLRTILEAIGVEDIREARDGDEAMRELQDFDASIALVDWKMQNMDGIECVRQIRSEEGSANPYLPVIMVTAYSDHSLVQKAQNAGVHEFLGKPITARDLLQSIANVLERPKSFIKAPDYFGPDRRRRDLPVSHDERRSEQRFIVSEKEIRTGS